MRSWYYVLGIGMAQKCFGHFSLCLFLSLYISLSLNYVIINGKIVGNQNFGTFKFPWHNIWARIRAVFIFLISWYLLHQIKVGLPFTTILVEFFFISISTSDEMSKISDQLELRALSGLKVKLLSFPQHCPSQANTSHLQT